MNVTHQNVIDYIDKHYNVHGNNYYEVIDGKLHIKKWVIFDQFTYNALPNKIVFDCVCDLTGSNINALPVDIVLKDDLYIFEQYIILPVLNIGGRIFLKDSHAVIVDCTYIGCYIRTVGSKYCHLDLMKIDGYFFITGILS